MLVLLVIPRSSAACNANETLLEINASTCVFEGYEWQVIDDFTGDILYACPGSNEMPSDSFSVKNTTCY